MFQLIITHAGLSLGEVESINNLFSDYSIYESTTDNDFEYASIVDIEFLKYKKITFFDFVSIESWTFLIEIIKNIKKRRGSKGLKFRVKITNVDKFDYDEDEEEPIIYNKTVFLLNHKNDLYFIKGLERIEIAIENIVEIDTFKHRELKERFTNNKSTKDKIQNKEGNNEDDLIIFVYDEINRKWIRSLDITYKVKNKI